MSETLMIKPIRTFLSYSSYPVSPLTYHCELIDAGSKSGARRLLHFTHCLQFYIKNTNPITQPPHTGPVALHTP